jgi:hypothetical protein
MAPVLELEGHAIPKAAFELPQARSDLEKSAITENESLSQETIQELRMEK